MFPSKLLWLTACLACTLSADVSGCACDPARPDTMKVRQCSLCAEAERHSSDAEFFLLKDNNPRKPNRWLILPRTHESDGVSSLPPVPAERRTRLWEAAIAKGRELFGDGWGLAMNGDKVRTQCHAHIHIGRFIPAEAIHTGNFIVVAGPADIPMPKDGTGLWIHPVGDKLHIHLGEQTCETVLFR